MRVFGRNFYSYSNKVTTSRRLEHLLDPTIPTSPRLWPDARPQEGGGSKYFDNRTVEKGTTELGGATAR